MRKTLTTLSALLAMALFACQPLNPPASQLSTHPNAALNASTETPFTYAAPVTPLTGQVDFATTAYAAQAVPSEVINQSTISLIDTSTGVTRVAGITDAAGNFSLPFSTFNPAPGQTFVLEAVKGLNSQLPGNDAPRFRTIVRYDNPGWASISNSLAGGRVVINSLTTAIALVSGLDQGQLPYANTIGMVNALVSPPGLSGSPALPASHPAPEILNLNADILSILTANADPVAFTDAIKPQVDQVVPTTAPANAPVTIRGTGFLPGGTTVTIGGATAPILAMKRYLAGFVQKWELIVTVPSGAITGNLTVSTTRGGTSNATAFTIPDGSAVSITAISPNPARPGNTLTLSGTGFSSTLGGNDIRLNGIQLTPIFANQTTLVLVLPSTTTSGNVSVTVNGATSNNFYLTVDVESTPQIASLFPSSGAVKSPVLLRGTNFGPSGSVVVGGYQAKILSWNPKNIRIEMPWHLTTGAKEITVFSQFGVATSSFSVIAGNLSATATDTGTTLVNVGGNGTHAWVGDGKLWVWGGGGSNAVNYIRLNPDGSFADADWTLSSMTLPMGTNQDDNPNDDVVVKNRIYYTVSNSQASNGDKINFATLDPYTGDVTGFGYDPTNNLPGVGTAQAWLGKDLALAASDKYVYIAGAGVSCSGGGFCGGNNVGTMQSRILPSGGIGIWETGPNSLYYGEDAYMVYIGGVLHLLSGNDLSQTGGSQFSVIKADGTLGTWTKPSTPVVPQTGTLSTRPVRVGKYLYLLCPGGAGALRAEIVDDLVLKPTTAYATTISPQSHMKVDVAVGRYLYSIGDYTGNAYRRKVYRYTLN